MADPVKDNELFERKYRLLVVMSKIYNDLPLRFVADTTGYQKAYPGGRVSFNLPTSEVLARGDTTQVGWLKDLGGMYTWPEDTISVSMFAPKEQDINTIYHEMVHRGQALLYQNDPKRYSLLEKLYPGDTGPEKLAYEFKEYIQDPRSKKFTDSPVAKHFYDDLLAGKIQKQWGK